MHVTIIKLPNESSPVQLIEHLQKLGMLVQETSWQAAPIESAAYILMGEFFLETYPRQTALALQNPWMILLKAANQAGKPIIGIGGGAQLLVEAGLVPGVENNRPSLVLQGQSQLSSSQVECVLKLSVGYQRNVFTKYVQLKQTYLAQCAINAGEFIIPRGLLDEMQINGQLLLQYDNDTIAAITNKAGNVLAISPRIQLPEPMLRSMQTYLQSQYISRVAPLNYFPRCVAWRRYQCRPGYHEQINKEEIFTVNNVKVMRMMHSEVVASQPPLVRPVAQTYLLVRPRAQYHGMLWCLQGNKQDIDAILETHILFNPLLDECFYY